MLIRRKKAVIAFLGRLNITYALYYRASPYALILGSSCVPQEPNTENPLNEEAAEEMRKDREKFAQIVAKTMTGYYHNNVRYPCCLVDKRRRY